MCIAYTMLHSITQNYSVKSMYLGPSVGYSSPTTIDIVYAMLHNAKWCHADLNVDIANDFQIIMLHTITVLHLDLMQI